MKPEVAAAAHALTLPWVSAARLVSRQIALTPASLLSSSLHGGGGHAGAAMSEP
jgi:hypothetical protein